MSLVLSYSLGQKNKQTNNEDSMKHSFLLKKTTLWQSYRDGKMLTTWSPLAKPE